MGVIEAVKYQPLIDNFSGENLYFYGMKRFLASLSIRLTALCALLAMPIIGNAENSVPDFSFIHYTTDNGLPSNRVRDIAQDSDGFIWFATDGGLVRFDGVKPQTFIPQAKDQKEDDIFVLSVCPYGRNLLVGTDHSLYIYNPESESVEPFAIKYPKEITQRLSGAVRNIRVESTGVIWVSVEGKGIFRINVDGMVTGLFAPPQVPNDGGVLYIDNDDTVWCVFNTHNDGVYKFDRSGGVFRPFVIKVNGQEFKAGGYTMTRDSNGDFWLGTKDKGLVRFNGRSGEGWIPDPSTGRPGSDLWHIHSICQYSSTRLLVGSDSGLSLVDMNTGETRVYAFDELSPNGLSDRFVYTVMKDAEGGFWIGTFYYGVNYLSHETNRFRKWTHSRFSNSVSGNVVSRLCEDSNGNIWIGTADGGLSMYDPGSSLFRHYSLDGSNFIDNINALCADGNKLWVGTYSRGAGYLDISTGKMTRIPTSTGNDYSCYAIRKDSQGTIWMASTNTLTRYDAEKREFVDVLKVTAWINDIDEDRSGELWISTQGAGLYRYNPATRKYVNFVSNNFKGSLPHNHINSVEIDSAGEILIATPKGVYVYDKDGNIFKPVRADAEGIVAQAVMRSGNDLWVPTLSGLVYLRGDGQHTTYTRRDGLSDNQFVAGASLQASDGKIYFGTIRGFSMVDPLEVRSKAAAPKLIFTSLEVEDKSVYVGDRRLPQSLNSIDKLTLSHDDYSFSIYFAALSYANPEANTYRYMLEGYDKTWRDAGKENRASYSNVPPGKYTLRIKGANSDDVWNEEGISLPIEIRPAWYASIWMKIIYGVLIVAALLWIIKSFLRRSDKLHKKELDRIANNQEKEMYRSKLSFFTVVAHEIRTPVSLIMGPLEKVLESKEKFSPEVREDLMILDRNARRLLSLVNQLLDFRKVENHSMITAFHHENITALVEGVADRFRPSVEHKGGRLLVDCGDTDIYADVDPEALVKLLSNLLNNARKFTKDEIRVRCRILPSGDRFELMVSDNGMGISRDNHDKIFKPFFQIIDNINESKGGTGLGLSIVKSIAESHGGDVSIESTPGEGATFRVVLPLKQSNVMPVEGTDKDVRLGSRAPELPAAAGNSEGNNKPLLLVVDDNEEMLQFIASNFEKEYDVITALNGKDALERMKSCQVSLIICDWMMPVMDGVEFLKKVRSDENYSHIPFVMLTAKTDNVSKIETMKSGADAYVEKPFSIGFLEARIGNLLKMRELLRQKFSESPLEPISTIAPTHVDNEFLQKLQSLIEDNFSNPELNIDFIAEQLGISRSGLYYKINALANVSPKELIEITRLKKAAQLLREGKYRVNEICYMVGFGSASYFSRCFRKQFGVTPGEFQHNCEHND